MSIGNFSPQWQDGVKAFLIGRAQHQNPYRRDSVDGEEWRDGWRFARAYQYIKPLVERLEKNDIARAIDNGND